MTSEQVEALAQRLDALAEKPRTLTTREVVKMLKSKIGALRARGYSFDDIANELVKNGLHITGSSLKAYTGAAATKRAARPRKPSESSKTASNVSLETHGTTTTP